MKTITNITCPAFALFALACFAFSPRAQAVCQDGCLDNLNTALGVDALESNTTGLDNTAIGWEALDSNTSGGANTASGLDALFSNTTGNDNTATGVDALFSNNTGNDNTANGFDALKENTIGSRNVAIGSNALYSNQIGGDNTATGVNALYYNTGNYNTANGYQALESNTTGTNNTASGLNSLNLNTTGSNNAASGAYALYSNITASNNTAHGLKALYKNTSGFSNTASGGYALYYNTTGHGNIALGFDAGFSLTIGSNNIDIGNLGVAAESDTIRIGTTGTQTKTYIAGISGVTVAGGVGVIVDTNGHLGTVVSSERFKDAIKPMDKSSEAILALKPVTFHYKQELDPDGIPQFGLVAEEVEKVNPDLVARDEKGKPYTVRYEAVNAMLLNEFLKEHRRNDAQQKQIDALTAVVKEQAAQIQKVSAQGAADKSSARLVVNNP